LMEEISGSQKKGQIIIAPELIVRESTRSVKEVSI
jgi:hypothetical protein